MTEYLLDTNAINQAVDLNIDPAKFASRSVYITHIQVDELRATKKPPGRLEELLVALQKIAPANVPTAAALYGVSQYGAAEYGDAAGTYAALLESLNVRNCGNRGNMHDALIGATALLRGLTLVTNDTDLTTAVHALGGDVVSFETFVEGKG